MAVTFENQATGQRVSCPEPDDEPVRRQHPRARRIAQFDASDDWERVGVSRVQVEPSDTGVPSAAEVRAWAKEQDIEVPARGKLSAGLVEGYKQAHAPQE